MEAIQYKVFRQDTNHLARREEHYESKSRVVLLETALGTHESMEAARMKIMTFGEKWVEYVILPVMTRED